VCIEAANVAYQYSVGRATGLSTPSLCLLTFSDTGLPGWSSTSSARGSEGASATCEHLLATEDATRSMGTDTGTPRQEDRPFWREEEELPHFQARPRRDSIQPWSETYQEEEEER